MKYWFYYFSAKFQDGLHLFTFVFFLLQAKKVTKKPRGYATAHRCASIGLKLKPTPHAGKLLLSKAKQAYLKPGKPSLAANILFVSLSANKPAFLPTRFLIS
ncbi:hypothetical protein [Echinicola rosea]|uniref:hypothetical protein n=1 Tax=Echinicola rosea TaxID=1807691 RepID=UPI0010CA7E90|nr:hypothetical protein [Echinicola rosea]